MDSGIYFPSMIICKWNGLHKYTAGSWNKEDYWMKMNYFFKDEKAKNNVLYKTVNTVREKFRETDRAYGEQM